MFVHRAQAGRLVSSTVPLPQWLARSRKEAANTGWFPPLPWIVPECRHQAGGVAGVELGTGGGIGRPAAPAATLGSKPPGTARHAGQCGSGGRANADFDKVLAKEPSAENGVVVATPSLWRGRTSTQVRKCWLNAARSMSLGIARLPKPGHGRWCAAARKYRIRPCRRYSPARLGAAANPSRYGPLGPRRRCPSIFDAGTVSNMFVPAATAPSVAEPTGAQDRAIMEIRSAAIHRKMSMPARQLPITKSAHKTAVCRRWSCNGRRRSRTARHACREPPCGSSRSRSSPSTGRELT